MLQPSAIYFHVLVDKDPFYQPYLMLIREVSCLKILNQTDVIQQQLHSNISTGNRKLFNSWVQMWFVVMNRWFTPLRSRLQILEEYGGVLLDLNVTMLRPSDDFYALDFVIGEKKNDFGIFLVWIE